jgi:hypothetical protein
MHKVMILNSQETYLCLRLFTIFIGNPKDKENFHYLDHYKILAFNFYISLTLRNQVVSNLVYCDE